MRCRIVISLCLRRLAAGRARISAKKIFRDLTGTVPKHTLRIVYIQEKLRDVDSITLLEPLIDDEDEGSHPHVCDSGCGVQDKKKWWRPWGAAEYDRARRIIDQNVKE